MAKIKSKQPSATSPVNGGALKLSELMPACEEAREILKQRALAVARALEDDTEWEQRETYIRFRLGANEHYGIPYSFVEEVLNVGVIARVPCTPAFIHGVTNRRGEMLTVLDLKQFFRNGNDSDYGDDARIVVVKHEGVQVGILVDELVGNGEYAYSQLSPPLPSDGVANIKHVSGIFEGRITMLNMAALLSDPAIVVNESVA